MDRLFTSPSRKRCELSALEEKYLPGYSQFRRLQTAVHNAGLRKPGSISGSGKGFSLLQPYIPLLGHTQPLNQWLLGPFSPQVKRPGHEVTRLEYEGDNSLPSSAEVKKE